ncbi:hypothetical protein Droror1_Dr00007019 [Drosera rotundifolia]
MYKQSPSRNYRSKGIKVKHVLQICLLLAVCFWLLYQVKRSHEKKREFDEKEAKLVADMERAGEIMKFGRKDLSRLDNAAKHEKLVEDNEENEGEEDEGKPEEEEQDPEETKVDDREEDEDDLLRGGSNDVDEHDLEKTEAEAEAERDEEFMDEEKEREEAIDEKAEEATNEAKGNSSIESAVEEQDHDGASQSNREELYKADDASSEVAHDTHTSNPDRSDTSGTLEQTDEGKASEEGTPSNATAAEEQNHKTANWTKLETGSHPKSTILMESNDLAEDQNKTIAASSETTSAMLINGTEATSNTSSRQNLIAETQVIGDDTLFVSGKNLSGTANTTEHVNAGGDELLSSSNNTTIEAKTTAGTLTTDGSEEGDAEIHEKSKTDVTNGSSESQPANENAEAGLQDPIDASDSSITDEDKEARMDLSTLPDIRDNVGNTDEAAEE